MQIEIEQLPIKLQALVDKINEGHPTTRQGLKEYYGYIEERLTELVAFTKRCRVDAYQKFDEADKQRRLDANYILLKPLIEEYQAKESKDHTYYLAEVNGRNIFFELTYNTHEKTGWHITEHMTPRICVENAKRKRIPLTDLKNLDKVREKIKAILYAD